MNETSHILWGFSGMGTAGVIRLFLMSQDKEISHCKTNFLKAAVWLIVIALYFYCLAKFG